MSGSGSVYKWCGCRATGVGERTCPRLKQRGYGSWYFSVRLEHVPGRRCRVRRGGFASWEAARVALRRAQSIGASVTDLAMWMVVEWFQHWLDGWTRLRPRTRVGYQERVDRLPDPLSKQCAVGGADSRACAAAEPGATVPSFKGHVAPGSRKPTPKNTEHTTAVSGLAFPGACQVVRIERHRRHHARRKTAAR